MTRKERTRALAVTIVATAGTFFSVCLLLVGVYDRALVLSAAFFMYILSSKAED